MGTQTILVVDDELVCLELTAAMLTRLGYRVIAAQSGREALRLLESNPEIRIDLGIIDIVMQDLTGLELARELRRARPELPILFMSSFSQDPTLRPPETRNIPFLAKPFSSITLVKTIQEMLPPQAAQVAEPT